jgi:hypothetical protein
MKSLLITLAAGALTTSAFGIGRFVAVGDEWIVSDQAFTLDSVNTAQFVLNTASYFANGGSGNFLVYSTQPQYAGVQFASTLSGGGHTLTIDSSTPLTPSYLATFDGVFVAGTLGADAGSQAALTAFVNAGGGVFLQAGTGAFGSALAEANACNPFLASFGLAFGDEWKPVSALINAPVNAGTHPLQSGLTQVIWGFGQDVIDLDGISNNANTIAMRADFSSYGYASDSPIVGVFNVPSPGAAGLLLASMLVGNRRRRS